MKRTLFFLFLLIFSFGSAQDFPEDSVKADHFEHILNFHSDITISKDAQITITEKIKVYAAGINIKRGIFRTLPLWRNINNKKVRINYDIISVQKNDSKEDYHTKNSGSDFTVYFGNKKRELSPGFYEYELKYTTDNQIGFFKDYDEFYWNVNGALWDYKADAVSAKITLPNGAEITRNSCYTGIYSSKASNCTGEKTSANTIDFSAKNLQDHEGLTIAVGFKKGIFTPPPPPTFLEKYGIAALLMFATLALTGYFYTSWKKYGIDPQKPVVYPQFNAPQNLSPASLGYLEHEYYSNNMISAAIVSLGVKGFIKVIENDKRILGIFGGREYTLEKTKEPDQNLPKEEINLMNLFFPGEEKTLSMDGKYSSKIENAVNSFKASLQYQHDPFLKKGNNSGKLIFPALLIIFLYALGLFFSFKLTYIDSYLGIGIILGLVGFVFTTLISFFYERYKATKYIFGLVSLASVLIFISVFLADTESADNPGFYASYAFLIFGFMGIVLFQYLIKQPSAEKLEIQSLIEGFKMYLGTAEEKTLQFHNPPEMTPMVFEKMLPYAMVLDVDKIWGEKFQNMLQRSAVGGNESYHSNWFIGASLMNMNFASSLNSSLSQSIASSSTQPSSSGSGSGGGGFSGGGGGGGGGGGW